MIFLTVGTTHFGFERLLKAVDEALLELGKKELLVAQTGSNKYVFSYPYLECFQEISFGKVVDLLSKSRLVICHGGLGTVFLGLNYCRNKPIVFPRVKKFNEHVDDHQLFFVKHLGTKNLIKVVFPEDDLPKKLKGFILTPEKNDFSPKEAENSLANNLITYTQKLN